MAGVAMEPGGALLQGGLDLVARLDLHLACASRVLVTVGSFRATALGELERKAADLDWAAFASPGDALSFRVTCRKSRLYHTGAVAERLCRAAGGGGNHPERCHPNGEDGADGPDAQRFVVRIVRDEVTVRADASGPHLHRRGYRLATGRAPLRETLAAGVLRLAGWTPDRSLVDPLCGSGTFVIEAALRACRRPPGLDRRFAFERWPAHDAAAWEVLKAEARRAWRLPPAPLMGSDRDAGAVESATANAARAGVGDAVAFRRLSISEVRPPAGAEPGYLVANPPWGRRVGSPKALRDLHARLGQVARDRFPGWTLALLSPTPALVRQVDRRAEAVATVPSGGVPVAVWRVPAL